MGDDQFVLWSLLALVGAGACLWNIRLSGWLLLAGAGLFLVFLSTGLHQFAYVKNDWTVGPDLNPERYWEFRSSWVLWAFAWLLVVVGLAAALRSARLKMDGVQVAAKPTTSWHLKILSSITLRILKILSSITLRILLLIILGVLFILVCILFARKLPEPLGVLTLVAELAVAFVIYYEVEEHRATSFLEQARGKAYKERARIYEEFLKMPGATLNERAKAFRKHLWRNPELRRVCDHQLLHFTHLKYILRRSLLHSTLLEEVFPQVPVCLWAMLSAYIQEIENLRWRKAKELMVAVIACINGMENSKKGLRPIFIFSGDKTSKITISVDDLMLMRNKITSKLKDT